MIAILGLCLIALASMDLLGILSINDDVMNYVFIGLIVHWLIYMFIDYIIPRWKIDDSRK